MLRRRRKYVKFFPESGRRLGTDWPPAARSHWFRLLIFVSLLSLSPFPPFATTQSKFSSRPLSRRALSCPNTEVGMAGWDLSLLIQYRYPSQPPPRSPPRRFSFPYFRALSFSRLAINDHRSADQVDVMTTRACTRWRIFATFPRGGSKSVCLKSGR